MCNRETNWLILFKEVIIYYENLMQHISSLWQNAEFLNVTGDGMCHITFGPYNKSH